MLWKAQPQAEPQVGRPWGDEPEVKYGELHSRMSGRLEYAEFIQRSAAWTLWSSWSSCSLKLNAFRPLLQSVRIDGDSGEGESGPNGMSASNSRVRAEMLKEGGVPLLRWYRGSFSVRCEIVATFFNIRQKFHFNPILCHWLA